MPCLACRCRLPAQTLEGFAPQMRKNDRLQVGVDADIVVFDPAVIADKATYEDASQPRAHRAHAFAHTSD